MKVVLLFTILFLVGTSAVANSGSTSSGELVFECQTDNFYNFKSWVPIGDFLQLDNTKPENWTVSVDGKNATSTGSSDGPTAFVSGDVWTGKVTFSGTFKVTGKTVDNWVGILVGVVSPKSRFILIDWVNADQNNLGCDTLVEKGFLTIPKGITVRGVTNPLGQSERQQWCNLFSPVSQPKIMEVWSHKKVAGRKPNTMYGFNVTLNTFANTLAVNIFEVGAEEGEMVFEEVMSPGERDLTDNFTLGTWGAFSSQQTAVFSDFIVHPHTCGDNYYANCGYACPKINQTSIDSDFSATDDDDDGEMAWWGILLIILLILIVCLCCCVCIAAVVLFLRR